jgi:hypothetical protein
MIQGDTEKFDTEKVDTEKVDKEKRLKNIKFNLERYEYDMASLSRANEDFKNDEKEIYDNLKKEDIPYIGFSLGSDDTWEETILYNREDHPNGVNVIDVIQKAYFDPKNLFVKFDHKYHKKKIGEPYFSRKEIKTLISNGSIKIDWEPEYGLEPTGEICEFGEMIKVIEIKNIDFMFKTGSHIIRRVGKTFRPFYIHMEYYDDWLEFYINLKKEKTYSMNEK